MSLNPLTTNSLTHHPIPLQCCMLVDQLKKDWYLLQQEAMNLFHLEMEYNQKQDFFIKRTQELDAMIKNVCTLADEPHTDNETRSSIYKFVSNITKSWCNNEDAIAQEVSTRSYFSCTSPDMPLSCVLEKVQSSTNTIMETFKTISGHFICFSQSASMYHKIIPLTVRLSQGSQTYHHSLSLDKAIPYVKDLKVIFKTYVTNLIPYPNLVIPLSIENDNDYVLPLTMHTGKPETDKPIFDKVEDVSTFQYVIKLLTGELLGHEEPLNYKVPIEPVVSNHIPELQSLAAIMSHNKPRLPTDISQYQCNPHELYCLVYGIQGMELYMPEERIWQPVHHNPMVWSQQEFYHPFFITESKMEPPIFYHGSQERYYPSESYMDQEKLYQYHRTNETYFTKEHTHSLITHNSIAGGEDYSSIYSTLQELPKLRRPTQALRRRMTTLKTKSPLDDANDLQPIKVPRLQQHLFKPLI